MKAKCDEKWDKHVDNLINLLKKIQINGTITILTGGNGRGKSLIRKLIPNLLKAQYKIDKPKVHSISMDDRAGIDPNRFMAFSRDCEWLPTSINTFGFIENINKAKDCFVILDEIEIGMSEESQYGIALYINKFTEQLRNNTQGVLIITHSKYLVKYLDADEFLNIEGMTKDEWLNREIIPTNFDILQKDSSELFRAIDNRLIKH